jgi:peroxiredoxin family protein
MSATTSLSDHTEHQLSDIVARLERLERTNPPPATTQKAISLLVFGGELDKLLAAFTIATAAGACGMKVSMFFTFWGTAALKQRTTIAKKSWMERAFGLLLPGGLERRSLSRLDMGGVGRQLINMEMRRKNISSLPELIAQSASLGVEIYVCQMSMDLMGIRAEELIEYPNKKICGAAKFLQLANAADSTLFI